MDINSFDIEFFDFENASEEEIKEIHAILKGPGNNGSVELPWETSLRESCIESLPENEKEGTVEKTDPSVSIKNTRCLGSVIGPALHFTSPQDPLSPPVARPPNVEAFIAPPSSVGPYPPYIMSRTIPYLRAYHHMGMPFFACPIPGNTGEPAPLPYGQFVPVVPATIAQEKFLGHIDSESNQKSRPEDKQYNRRSKKKSSSDYSPLFVSETVVDAYREVTLDETVSSPTVSNDRPTTVPIVPLPVSPSTFGVAGGTIPLHGYPPGLHTLPYPQMSGPQAPSAAMYYVPVFNHPYSSYLPSPSAPMVLPVNLLPDASGASPQVSTSSENATSVDSLLASSLAKDSEIIPHVQSNCEEQTSRPSSEEKTLPTDSAAKNVPEGGDITDCNSSPDYPNSKSLSSSPDYIPDPGMIRDDFYNKCAVASADDDLKRVEQDPSRCWADLFKKPNSQVNGIDHQHRQGNTLDKGELYTNGKVYTSASDVH